MACTVGTVAAIDRERSTVMKQCQGASKTDENGSDQRGWDLSEPGQRG